MADATQIEWARHPVTGKGATWNIVTGCQVVSPGCKHCYAMALAGTRLRNHPSREGLTIETKAGPVWNGKIRFNAEWLSQPLQWSMPRGIFVCAHGDLFAEGVTDEMLDQIFAVMSLAPQHIFFVLTKRPERMREYLMTSGRYGKILRAADPLRQARPRLGSIPISDLAHPSWWPQVWVGTSVEDNARAIQRRGPMEILSIQGWTTFVSYEPALGPVNWNGWEFLDWMISGGESGHRARASHPDWHRQARDFCSRSRIPYFFKQWGSWSPAPWRLERGLGESADDYKARSDATAATHAVKIYDGYIHEMVHRAWSVGRGAIEPEGWAGIRKSDKKTAGHILDGLEHQALPEVRT